MQRLFLIVSVLAFTFHSALSQEIVRSEVDDISIVKKSSKVPQLRMEDGMALLLQYDQADESIHVKMVRNGKNLEFCDPFPSATFVQALETDVDGDERLELILAERTAANEFTIHIYKRPEFEFEYQIWASIPGQNYAEFPGNSNLILYDMDGGGTSFKISFDGKLKVSQ